MNIGIMGRELQHIKLWNFAAGALIVSEAGGVISGFDNQLDATLSHHILASSSPILHRRVVNTLAGYLPDIL